MCVVFRRRHYNKALLALLSTFLHLEENDHALCDTLRKHLVAFDEYPVENFHSLLRRRTKDTDSANVIANTNSILSNQHSCLLDTKTSVRNTLTN